MTRPSSARRNPFAGDNATLARVLPPPSALQLSPWRSALAFAGDWACIAASFAAAVIWPHWAVYALAAVLIARSQLALSVLMHEGAHHLLARRRGLNDALGQWLAAGPLWLSLRSYRSGHLRHHRVPMQAHDPVALVFDLHALPVSRAQLAKRLLAYACGLGYARTVLRLARGDFRAAMPATPKTRHQALGELASMLGTNGLGLALLWAWGQPGLYVGLWLLPAVTLLPLFGQVRALFEHGGLPASADQSQNARSMPGPTWQSFLFGPHAVYHHIEHHLFPRVPHYHLRTVHLQLLAQGVLPPARVLRGYGQLLREVSTRAASNTPIS